MAEKTKPLARKPKTNAVTKQSNTDRSWLKHVVLGMVLSVLFTVLFMYLRTSTEVDEHVSSDQPSIDSEMSGDSSGGEPVHSSVPHESDIDADDLGSHYVQSGHDNTHAYSSRDQTVPSAAEELPNTEEIAASSREILSTNNESVAESDEQEAAHQAMETSSQNAETSSIDIESSSDNFGPVSSDHSQPSSDQPDNITDSSQNAQNFSVSARRGCEKGWKKHKQSCYKFFERNKAWDQSKSHCESFQSHLVTFETWPEHVYVTDTFVPRNVKDKTRLNEMWIGGEYSGATWRWISNSKPIDPKWTSWGHRGPEGHRLGPCLALYIHDLYYGKMFDINCHFSRPYVCEYDL